MVNLTYANIIWTIFHKSQETVGCDQQNREGNYETHMLLNDKHVEESSKKKVIKLITWPWDQKPATIEYDQT